MIKFKASFDDGCKLDLRVAALLDKYGFDDVTFYIPSNWSYVNKQHGDAPLSIDELKLLAERYNIGSHTITHPMLTRIADDDMVYQIVESKNQLETILNQPIVDFCYPRGYANDDIRDVVRKHYKTARNTLIGNLDAPDDPVWETPTVHISGKRRTEYEHTNWHDEAYRLLDLAINRDSKGIDSTYHLWGHSWEIERYSDWGEFEKLLMWISKVRE